MTRNSYPKTATAMHVLLLSAVVYSFLHMPLVARAADEPSKESKENFLKTNTKFLEAFKKPVSKPAQSTVEVLADGREVALGTIVGPDGWILTKASEISLRPVVKFKDGRELVATVVGVQPQFDLAMLKVDAKGLVAVEFQESKVAPVGNWVASVGQAEAPLAVGVVSVAARTLSAAELKRPLIIAASGFLGIGLDQTKDGPKINSVVEGGAAAKIGMKLGDHVIAINGKHMEDPETVINTLAHTKPGDVVVVKIKRGDEELEFKPKLEKRPTGPADRSDFQNRMGSELSDRRTGFPTFVQHDTVLKPKDCGGPLVDLDGKVIGINIARAGRVETYAIPSEALLPLLTDLMSGKLPPKEDGLKPVTPEQKLAADMAELAKAREDRIALEKRTRELAKTLEKGLKEGLSRLEEEKALADQRVEIIRNEVLRAVDDGRTPPAKDLRQKAEDEQKAAIKHLNEAKAALKKLEEESK